MYAHDSAAGEKHLRAKALVEELWESRSGAVSSAVRVQPAQALRAEGTRDKSLRASLDGLLISTLRHFQDHQASEGRPCGLIVSKCDHWVDS